MVSVARRRNTRRLVDDWDTLLPQEDQHVIMYLGNFRCAGTARNYVGVIRWACNSFKLGRSWDSDLISQTLHGLDKNVSRLLGPVKHQRTLLTQLLVTQVASLGMQMVSEEFTVATLIFWEFLLRVQSEGVPMQVGTDKELFELAPSRHSALSVVQNLLVLRLTRRKHRPEGSTLKRGCRCALVGREACAVCMFKAWHQRVKPSPGTRIWTGTASQYLHQLRRC